jgi:putative SOS response-associated peptidase YedK
MGPCAVVGQGRQERAPEINARAETIATKPAFRSPRNEGPECIARAVGLNELT